jgi:hypothetical protein
LHPGDEIIVGQDEELESVPILLQLAQVPREALP